MDREEQRRLLDEKYKSIEANKRFDKNVSEVDYGLNVGKANLAGVAGMPMDTLYNVRDLLKAATGFGYGELTGEVPPESLQVPPHRSFPDPEQSTMDSVIDAITKDRIGGSGTFAGLMDFDPGMSAPDPTTEVVSDIAGAAASTALFKKPFKMNWPTVAGVGTGSGVGFNLGKSWFPDDPEKQATVAMIVSAMTGNIGAGMRISPLHNIYQKVKEKLFQSPQKTRELAEISRPKVEAVARRDVENTIGRAIGDDPRALANIDRALELQKQAPGVKLDIAQATRVPSITTTAKSSIRTPKQVDEKMRLDTANREAIVNQIVSKGKTPDVGTLAGGRLEASGEAMSLIDRGMEGLGNKSRFLTEKVPPADVAALGHGARAIRKTEKDAAEEKVKEKMGEVEKAAEGQMFDVNEVVSSVETAMKQPYFSFKPEDAPAIAVRIANLRKGRKGVEIGSVKFDEIKALREAINADIADASIPANSKARRQRRELLKIKTVLDKTIADTKNTKLIEKYDAFNKHYREEYAPRFLEGINLKQSLTDSLGQSRVADDKMFTQYFKAGDSRASRQYLSLYGKNKDAGILMKDAIKDRYHKEVIGPNRTEILPERHAAFVMKYRSSLDALEKGGISMADDFKNIETTSKSIFEYKQDLNNQKIAIQKDLFTKVASDQFGVKSTDAIMGQVTKDSRQAKILVKALDSDGAEGMIGWYGDDMATAVTKAEPGAAGKALSSKVRNKEYMESYTIAFEKAHGRKATIIQVKKLEDLAELTERLATTEHSMAGDVAQKPGDISTELGFSTRTVFNLYRAVITGRTSFVDMSVALGGAFTTKQIQIMTGDIMNNIMTDPKVLEHVKVIAESQTPQSHGVKDAAQGLIKKIPSLWDNFEGWKTAGRAAVKAAKFLTPTKGLAAGAGQVAGERLREYDRKLRETRGQPGAI